MRRAAKVDANHAEIAAALRAIGCSVQSMAALGGGVPDLLVARGGKTMCFEVKDGKNGLTPLQEQWHMKWQGDAYIVRDAAEAIRIVEFWTR